jgi:hypothetical protein
MYVECRGQLCWPTFCLYLAIALTNACHIRMLFTPTDLPLPTPAPLRPSKPKLTMLSEPAPLFMPVNILYRFRLSVKGEDASFLTLEQVTAARLWAAFTTFPTFNYAYRLIRSKTRSGWYLPHQLASRISRAQLLVRSATGPNNSRSTKRQREYPYRRWHYRCATRFRETGAARHHSQQASPDSPVPRIS